MSMDKLTSFKAKIEENKNVKTAKRQNVKTPSEKEKVKVPKTLYLPEDVSEYLGVGKAQGKGSMSDQVTRLVRADMAKAK